jgi:hypothetical protein
MDWLERDQSLGRAVFGAGVLIYAIAIVTGWLVLRPRAATAGRLVAR